MTFAQQITSTQSDTRDVETLIVGFGFSVIPLLRELEARKQPYTLISEGTPIWQQLAAKGRLDFDMVSSFHASFYSEDQVAAGTVESYYATAREFYEYNERLLAQFRHRVIEDRVASVENYATHSLVRTTRGRTYKAHNVVFATGLTRPQNETIKNFDVSSLRDQTVVFSGTSDTINMMLARTVAQGNKVILLNNGFITLDKYVAFDIPGPKGSNVYLPLMGVRTGKRYALDLAQLEAHAVERLWPKLYKDLMPIPLGPPEPESWIAKLFLPNVFHVRYPETFRRDAVRSSKASKAGLANGLIGIKYWPIDCYETLCSEKLEERVREGVLVNDIVFFHTEGLVESWSKDRTSVDTENKTISCDGRVVEYDHFIQVGKEEPRLPPIVSVDEEGRAHAYRYDYRENYLGVVPSKLRNVFFIGYTRPFTGGIANMTEMQGLMVHKLLSDSKKTEQLYGDIQERLSTYNDYYYPKGQERRPTDHLVCFGLYTDDVARFIGIDRKLSDCASWNPLRTFRNLRFDLLHPNNAIKYRMQGEYKVEGADKLCRDYAAHHENWSVIFFLFLSTLWDRLLGYLFFALLFVTFGLSPTLRQGFELGQLPNLLGWGALCSVGTYVFHRNMHVVNLLSYSLAVPLFGLKAATQPLAMLYIAYTGQWHLCLLLYAFWSAIAFVFRQFHMPPLSGRYLFADCKFKHKYRPFWERYKEVYQSVYAERFESTPPPRAGIAQDNAAMTSTT
ncbi:MAG TPA: hypothetical protein VFN67_36745 [Polyangiales bacterium]|nr:hypothetical protein [Polyangiales bacterium]